MVGQLLPLLGTPGQRLKEWKETPCRCSVRQLRFKRCSSEIHQWTWRVTPKSSYHHGDFALTSTNQAWLLSGPFPLPETCIMLIEAFRQRNLQSVWRQNCCASLTWLKENNSVWVTWCFLRMTRRLQLPIAQDNTVDLVAETQQHGETLR